MTQSLFETRQRAEELMRQAIAIWRQSDRSESLEGIEKDPVFSLLMTALAYQSNEIDNDIERLKNDVAEDIAHMLSPLYPGGAIPATAAVELMPADGVDQCTIDERNGFVLSGTPYKFLPALKTRAINCRIDSVERLDGRRWKLTLKFNNPIYDFSGFAFAIKDLQYRELTLSAGGRELPLISPTDYADMPVTDSLSIDTLLYNRSMTWRSSFAAIDMFARQNVRLYCIRSFKDRGGYAELPLIFEFSGIGEGFVFDRSKIALNATILANADISSVSLDRNSPVARISGSLPGSGEAGRQFLHLIRPSDEQIYSGAEIDVRRVAADRFNRAGLVKLLGSLMNKIDSDYYAFYGVKELSDERTLSQLRAILGKLIKAASADGSSIAPGVYVMLRQQGQARGASLKLGYVTCSGDEPNKFLDENSSFVPSGGIRADSVRQIAAPTPGFNEPSSDDEQKSYMRYYTATRDRIVTPYDIKIFCYNELFTRYGISSAMVEGISVGHRLQNGSDRRGYEIVAEIRLAAGDFVKRSFTGKISSAETLLQSLLTVRTNGIYPIRVNISIDEQQ